MGVSIGIMIICVSATVSCEVASCGFDAFVEATALHIVPGVVRPIPAPAILRETGGERSCRRCVNTRCREQYECRTTAERCDAKPVEIHLDKSPFHNPGELQLSGDLSNEC